MAVLGGEHKRLNETTLDMKLLEFEGSVWEGFQLEEARE